MATAVAPQPTRVAYGDDPNQFADLWLPNDAAAGDAPRSVVVLIHGGFWRAQYGLDLMDPLAADLVGQGFAVWNIEYRRVGQAGGGWPGTLEDVAAAIDQLVALDEQDGPDVTVDLDDVIVVGHSAGGHLALWAAGRDQLGDGQPGADPVVMPRLAIGQGPVGNLVEAAELGAGNGAVFDFLGGTPAEYPERYRSADPHIGADVAVVVVRGTDDTIVLADYTVPDVAGVVTVVDIEGEDHFDLIDPASRSWAAVVAAIDGRDDSPDPAATFTG